MAETIYITGTEVRFAAGKFDSDNFYLRAGTSGADFPMVQGFTIKLRYVNNGYATGNKKPNWKFDSTNKVVEVTHNGEVTFTATATTVKLT